MTRDEKKQQTRKSLMDSALFLVGEGENFANISLREVAKNAGVVPTAFYRHFKDMEELGLNLVDELGMMLRKLMRSARQSQLPAVELARNSVELYVRYVADHRTLFLFMSQCRTGGTPALRSGIRNELGFFATELATDIRQASSLPRIDTQDLEIISQLIITAVADTTIDILDQPENSLQLQELIEKTIKQLRVIFLGATLWESGRKSSKAN
jgi:AcrR family transcriptional regulator